MEALKLGKSIFLPTPNEPERLVRVDNADVLVGNRNTGRIAVVKITGPKQEVVGSIDELKKLDTKA